MGDAGRGRASAIGDYGFLSDCQSAALIDRAGSVNWWCLPRFDSPSVFGRLLGPEAGHWSLCPSASFESTRLYVPHSLVLRTVFTTAGGEVTISDALALAPGARGHEIGLRSPHVLVRRVDGTEGVVEMVTEFAPRMEYGLTVPNVLDAADGVVARGGPVALTLTGGVTLSRRPGCATGRFTVRAGEQVEFRLAYAPSSGPSGADGGDAASLEDTIAGWESWVQLHDGYRGRHRDAVKRSSLVLQGLTFQPTGAVVAAATTSLPEKIGGELNFDYRFAWLRDLLRQRSRPPGRGSRPRPQGAPGQLSAGLLARRADQRGLAPDRGGGAITRSSTQGGVMNGRLQDRIALITGSDSGIGQATAIEFAKEGADLVVHYLEDADGAEETRQEVEAQGRRAIVVQADIADEVQVARLFDDAVKEFGRIDILMNNAGVDASGDEVADLSTETFDKAIRTNLYGAFFCCRRYVRLRKAGGVTGGKIINVTSVHQDIPNAGGADYDCSKGALRMLTRTLALELAPLKINVNSLGPGMVLTPFNQAAIDDPELLEEQVQSIPWKRAAEPAEIGRLAVFLASADSDYVTGSTYFMDGGLMINLGQGA